MANVFYPGSTSNILIGTEGSSYGSAGTPSLPIGGHLQSASVNYGNDLLEVGSIGARATQQLVARGFRASASLDYLYQNGRLIAYALGTDAVSSSNPYVHTISLADAPTSFTAKFTNNGSAAIVQTMTGCVVDKLRLSADVNSPLSISAEILAKTTSIETSGAGSYTPLTDTVMAPQFTPSGNGIVYIGGVSIGQVQSLTMDINNNWAMPPALGSRFIQGAAASRRTIDWSMKINMDDATGIELFKELTDDSGAAYTPAALDIASRTFVAEFNNQGATSALRSIQLNCTGYKTDSLSLDYSVDGLTTMNVSGKITTFDSSPVICKDATSVNYITNV